MRTSIATVATTLVRGSLHSPPSTLPFGLVTKVIIDSRCVQTTAPVLVSTYVDELQGILNELENVVHPPLARSFSVPSFPDVKG